jgi:hypothetical protein
LVLVASAPVVLLERHGQTMREENARLLQNQSELSAANALLTEQVNRLEREANAVQQTNQSLREQVAALENQTRTLRSQGQSQTQQLAPAGHEDAEAGVIRFRKENVPLLRFEAMNEQFELTEPSKDVFQLTPEESSRVTAVLQDLKQRVHTHDLAEARPVPIEEVKDEDILRFLKGNPGQPTAFRIPPFNQQEQQQLKDWFAQSIEEVLGSERSVLFVNNARFSLDFWLGGAEDKILAFVDEMNADKPPVSSWMVKFNTPSSRGTYSGGSMSEPVPSRFKYLFDIHQSAPADRP